MNASGTGAIESIEDADTKRAKTKLTMPDSFQNITKIRAETDILWFRCATSNTCPV